MTGSNEQAVKRRWNHWRIARWTAALALLLTPLVMMQISDGWHWSIGSFLLAGTVLGTLGLLYELAEKANPHRTYRAGIAIVLAASFLTIWTTIVRDDGNGLGYFLLVIAAGVGAFAAWFRAAGMVRAMTGVAVIQALLGIGIATAPSTASVPGASFKVLVFNAVFAALWLLAAACFHAAAKQESSGSADHR